MKTVYLALRYLEIWKRAIIVVAIVLCASASVTIIETAAYTLSTTYENFKVLQPFFTETDDSFLNVLQWIYYRLGPSMTFYVLKQAIGGVFLTCCVIALPALVRCAIMMSLCRIREPERFLELGEDAHGESMADFVRGAWREWGEYSAVFKANGKKVVETTYLALNVTATPRRKCGSGRIFIHNHPLRSAAPSSEDFASAIQARASMAIVVDRSKKVYVLEVPKACWKLDTELVLKRHRELLKKCKTEVEACTLAATEHGMTFSVMTIDAFCQMAKQRGW